MTSMYFLDATDGAVFVLVPPFTDIFTSFPQRLLIFTSINLLRNLGQGSLLKLRGALSRQNGT